MSAAPPRSRCHKIRSIEVRGGFLDGVHIDLSENLNCFIGGRGAGKTTVLQFLRYALKDPQEPSGGRDKKELQSLVKKMLGVGGVIRVEIETRDGVSYVVERTLGGVEVLTADGETAGLSLVHNAVFDIDVFGPSEIEDTARTPKDQLALIDRFASDQLRPIDEELRAVVADLRSNGTELLTLTLHQDELSASLAELPGVLETLAAQQRGDEAESGAQIARELAGKAMREREQEAFKHMERAVTWARESAHEAARRSRDLPIFDPEALAGPNAALLQGATDALRRFQGGFARLEAEAQRLVDETLAELKAARDAVTKAHGQQDVKYRHVLAAHEQERGRADERLRLQRRAAELQEKKRLLAERTNSLDSRQRQRRDLLRRLSTLREERFRLRKGVADRLTAELGPLIRVRVVRADDRSGYQKLLSQVFTESGRASDLAETVAKATPADLVRIVLANDPQRLVELTGLRLNRATRVVEQLGEALATLYELEVVEVQDVPRIELDVGGVPKTADELSTGQRCTTILPILLLESERPLLVDQPEDNLDNKYICESIVNKICQTKTRRQLIFVTHNPNIPVLGDAECVVVLEATSGTQARVLDSGSVDKVKSHVETILEGGREAFEARRRKYAQDSPRDA